MPINVGGTIYVPYFHFDANQNGGIQFGIYNGGQDRVRNTLTLYNSEPRNLTFDLRTGISYDYYLDGVQQDPTAIIRGGQIVLIDLGMTGRLYLPLLWAAVHLQQHRLWRQELSLCPHLEQQCRSLGCPVHQRGQYLLPHPAPKLLPHRNGTGLGEHLPLAGGHPLHQPRCGK